MFDLGWAEMLLLGIVVLLVMGPRELPKHAAHIGAFGTAHACVEPRFSQPD